jgi:hypothetical protein
MNQTQLQELLGSTQFDMNSIIAMLIFSTIGIIYYRKGKANNDLIMRLCGFILFLYGYFVYEFVYLLIIGVLLIVIPIISKRFIQ